MQKIIIITIILVITNLIYAQIGNHIPVDRLPFDDDGILEWTKVGCLAKILT